MFASNMDIIDLCSDSEDSIGLCSDREDGLDSDDPNDGVDQPLVSPDTTFGQNNAEQPIWLEDDDLLNSTKASSSYRPADNRSATERSSELNNFLAPMNIGLNMQNSNGQYRTLPLSLSSGRHSSHPFSLTGGNNIESVCHRAPLVSAGRIYPLSSSSLGMPHDSSHAIPYDQNIDSVGAVYASNNNDRILPSSLTNGACHFPQSFTNGSSRSFGENWTKEELTVKSDSVQKSVVNGIGIPSSNIATGQKPYVSNSQSVSTENDDDDVYLYTVPPQSFPSSHSSLGDNWIKEEPTAKSNGFQGSVANGIGMPSSTMSTDDVYAYGGVHSHRIFPPSMPSRNSVNDAEIFNGLDRQSHLNIENRLFGCDERAVYQEALQHISQETREEDLPEGVMSVSLLKHQKIALCWMISKENSSHCSGGILADDQGLGKTISTIALIQKERIQQSKFMAADSYSMKSVALNLDEEDEVVMIMDKKELKGEDVNKLEASAPLPIPAETVSVATNLMPCASRSGTVVDRMVKTVKVEPKKKTRVSLPSSASTLRSAARSAAGTLVVCPASVLKQWANELSAKVTESSKLSVLVYHGGSRTRDPTELTKFDVVVTTYTIVAREVPKQNSDEDMEQKDSEMYGICPEFSVGNKRKLPKNTKMSKIEAKKKNKPKNSDAGIDGGPLARVRWFRVVLDEAQTIKNCRTQVAKACCGLRAKRRWCLSGTPMQNTIDDLYSYFHFLKYEPYCAYDAFRSLKCPISRGASHDYKKLQTVLKIILLRRTKETLIDGEPIIKLPPKTIQLSKIDFTQEERSFYLALEEGSRQKFKAYAAAGTIKENYANILVLLLRLRQACDHPLLLKGSQSNLIDSGCGSIEMAKQLPKETLVDLLEKLEGGPAICSICSDPSEDAVVATCGHVFCYQCVYESLASDENVCPSPCTKKLSAESVFSSAVLNLCISGKLESEATTSCSTAADESSSICESSYISSKIRAAMDILNSIVNTHALTGSDTIESSPSEVAPAKAIVFSQWTGMLDLLALSLKGNLIHFRRLDGAMSLNIREIAVNEFKTDPEVRVMLMSLKAGNLGLNMVAACHVIMLDPWWNPYAEDQAVDRAHRIGQTRPVTVSRLSIKDTAEDRILALQEKKRKMVQSAFGEDKSGGNATRLTVEDLGYLFQI